MKYVTKNIGANEDKVNSQGKVPKIENADLSRLLRGNAKNYG